MPRCMTCDHEYETEERWFEHFPECYACGVIYCADSPHFCDEGDSPGGIYSYDYRPAPNFLGSGPYFMGFELEISACSYDTTPIYRWCEDHNVPDMLYCKEDGSVSGFEIVSHPMTREFFDSVPWPEFFDMLQTHWPCRSEPEGHGLHVHVSRTAFPRNSVLARWNYFVNRNSDQVCRVARRNHSNWARFTDIPVSLCLPYERRMPAGRWEISATSLQCGCCYERTWMPSRIADRIVRQFQTRGYPERYQAINLTNEETVEVRAFRSTRSPEDFISSVHFVAASVEYARESATLTRNTRESLQWSAFAEYVASHPVFSKRSQAIAGIDPVPPVEISRGVAMREIREWLRANGIPVGSRGRIAKQHLDQFAAHTGAIIS